MAQGFNGVGVGEWDSRAWVMSRLGLRSLFVQLLVSSLQSQQHSRRSFQDIRGCGVLLCAWWQRFTSAIGVQESWYRRQEFQRITHRRRRFSESALTCIAFLGKPICQMLGPYILASEHGVTARSLLLKICVFSSVAAPSFYQFMPVVATILQQRVGIVYLRHVWLHSRTHPTQSNWSAVRQMEGRLTDCVGFSFRL